VKLPQAHQYSGYQWLRDHPKGLCADDMRLGKTLTATLSVHDKGPGVIACPASAKLIWRDHFRELNPRVKINILYGRSAHIIEDADVYITNYDILGDNLVRIPKRARYNWFLPDEFHMLGNPMARRTGAAQHLARHSLICHPLSGTPMPNRPIEWWPMLNALDITSMNYPTFAKRYAAAWHAPWSKDKPYGLDVRGASNLAELHDLTAPHILRRMKSQIIEGYKSPEIALITFDRPVDSRESGFNREVLRQTENPLLSIEGLSEVLKESALRKLPDCIEFIENRLQEEQKIIVFSYHHEVIDALQLRLAAYPSVQVTGHNTTEQKYALAAHFRSDPDCRLFFGNIVSAGQSIDLSVADTIICVETTFVPWHFRQAIERTESVFKTGRAASVYVLTTENSIDHFLLERIFSKEHVISQVVKPSYL